MLLPIVALQQALPPMDSPAPSQLAPIKKGPFQGNLESLKQNKYPTWFTEGKLGIWAHWGPQAVPMEGDWYARQMYEPLSKDYKDHLERFGHPSVKGYKDIIPLWKAEKWDPAALMKLYKAAGAKYFVSMGAHHDNFDLWNSTYHRWNAVKMGPHRDVVGDWAKAARHEGLRFGVSEHLGASWTWFQKARGSDAGGVYDGNDPAFSDLYHPAALPGDNGWYTTDPRWHNEWYRRVKDLVDQYHPDLLYSDGGIPFGDVGSQLVAHFYNTSISHGVQQGVYACKQQSEGRWAQDVERGVLGGIQEFPWQTDTSIGDWFYNKNWKFRGADWVIQTLVDVVSKNGNLLINVVQRPDGSLDDSALKVLSDMTAWMKANGESIYDTTPWLVYGEGKTRATGGAFKEDFGFSADDVRYVSKGDKTVYATLMGKPSGSQVVLRSLGLHAGDSAVVRRVTLLDTKQRLDAVQTTDGLLVTLPAGSGNEIATVLRIDGENLRGFNSISDPFPKPSVIAGADGSYDLSAELASLSGGGIASEVSDGRTNLGFWDSFADSAHWMVDVKAGQYGFSAKVACLKPSRLRMKVGNASFEALIPATGAWNKYVDISLGSASLSGGKVEVSASPVDAKSWNPINLRDVRLTALPR